MTATPSLLDNIVEDRTYQLHEGADGLGGTRWQLMRYERHKGTLLWNQVATDTCATPPVGTWRDAAFAWLRSLGCDPDQMDLVLFLLDAFERLRPDAA